MHRDIKVSLEKTVWNTHVSYTFKSKGLSMSHVNCKIKFTVCEFLWEGWTKYCCVAKVTLVIIHYNS